MPIISVFYGIFVYIFSYDNKQHHRPHIHIKCGDFTAVIAIEDGGILYGALPGSKMKLVQAWIEIHKTELLDDWELAVNGRKPFKIEPLR
jgi:hypothetical protein